MQKLLAAHQLQILSYHGCSQGFGMQFMWSQSVIHFSLIIIKECPQNTFLESNSAATAGEKSRRAGRRCKTQSWSLPFAQPLLFVPMGYLPDSGLLPELLLAVKAALWSWYILYMLHLYGYETLEGWGRFTPCLCHQKQSYTQSGQQQALWLQLWWIMPAWNLILQGR